METETDLGVEVRSLEGSELVVELFAIISLSKVVPVFHQRSIGEFTSGTVQ